MSKKKNLIVNGTILLVTWTSIQPCTTKAQTTFQFTEINVPGGLYPAALGINNAGMVAGNYLDGDNMPAGFIAAKGVFTEVSLPLAVAPFGEEMSDVNNAGTGVGGYNDPNGVWHSFIRTTDGVIKYQPDAFPNGPAPWTYMFHINSRGVIAGFGGSGADSTQADWRPFIWENGQYTILNIPGALYGIALGINDHNEVVGWYVDASSNAHAYVKRGSIYTIFDVPGAKWTNAFGINNQGQIVGVYWDGQLEHGFLLSDGVFYTVDYPGHTNNTLWDINDHGQAVGVYDFGNAAYLVNIVP